MANAFLQPQEELGTLQKIGRGLSAFGAGVGGRGPQFLAGLQAQERQLSEERQRAAAEDLRRARAFLDVGDLAGVRNLAQERMGLIQQLGGDPSDTAGILSLSDAALQGDTNALNRLNTEINVGLQGAADAGLIKMPAAREMFEAVLDNAGNIIGQRSTLTGKVVKDPRADLAPKAPKFEPVFDADGQVIAQRDILTGEVKTDPRVVAREKRSLEEQRVRKVEAAEEKIETATSIAVQNIEQTEATIGRLKKHPGLAGAVGFGVGARFFPGTDASDFAAIVETVQARLGFDELAKMRAASPTGGALGQISERELSFLQAANQSLSLSQSEDQFLENVELIEASLARLRKAQEEAVVEAKKPPSRGGIIRFDAQGNRI